jgi:hypothetical protein
LGISRDAAIERAAPRWHSQNLLILSARGSAPSKDAPTAIKRDRCNPIEGSFDGALRARSG